MRLFSRSLALVICVIAASSASAEWRWGGMAGASCWLPDWDHDVSGFHSDSNGMFGPAAFVHYGPVGFGVQYYRGSFDIELSGSDENLNADRTDLDLILSYRFARICQVSVLYKQIDFDWTQQVRVDTSIEGIGIGGGLTQVFRPIPVLVYGYGFYLPDLDHTQTLGTGESVTYDSDGFWLEAGTGYVFAPAHLILKAGYRFQKINASSDAVDWSEETKGFRFDISVFF